MSRRPEPDAHDQVAHHWLTQHQHALTQTLDDLLDTEAGLREILFQSHHDAATDNLDTVLDTEAGLTAILPTPTTPPVLPTDTHATTHHHADATELLPALSPSERMALRNNPDVKTASRALDRAHDRPSLRSDARNRAHALVVDLAQAQAQALDRALALAVTLDHGLDLNLNYDLEFVHALNHAHAIGHAPALARACDHAHALTRDRGRNHDRDRDLVRDLVRDLDLAHAADVAHHDDLVLDLVRARARALDLARAVDLARDSDSAARPLDPDLDRAALAEANRARAHTHVRGHGLIVEIRTAEVGRAIGLALRREPLTLDKGLLHTLLDDFTSTDLSNVHLTGIDLSGVHWSEHTTQWPPAVGVEALKTRSRETPPGSGTWVILRPGTATTRDLAER